jgi:alpha-ketoglutarate-dependent taurine dioxygenase
MHNIFQKQFVDLSHPNHKSLIVDKLIQNGLATFGPLKSSEELRLLGTSIGEVLIEEDTDKNGMKVETSSVGCYFHTDRSSQQSPPNVAIIRCIKEADEGGRTILADGYQIFSILRKSFPETLKAFLRPGSACFGKESFESIGSIFNFNSDGTVYIKFRFDNYGFFSSSLIPHLPMLQKILEDNTISFKLNENFGYAVNNGRWLHGVSPSKGKEKRMINRVLVRSNQYTSIKQLIPLGFKVDYIDLDLPR